MTPEELTQFQALAKKYEKGKDKEAVRKLLEDDMHEVFQEINDGGRTAANKAAEPVKAERDKLKTEVETLKGQLKAIDDKAPDVAVLRKKFSEDIAALEAKHTQELTAKDSEIVNVLLDNAKARLVQKISDKKHGGVDADYASTVLVKKEEVANRLRVGADKKVSVLRKGSTELTITPTAEKDELTLLAEELAETVEPKWKTSGVGRGSGTSGSTGGAGASGDIFQATRERVQAGEKARAETRKNGDGLSRLGRSR